jgi:hypothetical protein
MTFADVKMRAAQLCSLIIPAAFGAALSLALLGCHKTGAPAAEAESSRGLRVEAYDAPIPKAPLKGKLETMTPHPAAVAASSLTPPAPAAPPASSEPAALPPQAALEPLRLTLLRAADRRSTQVAQAQPAPLYSPAPARPVAAEAEAAPGFRITLPVCRRAAAMNDPLSDTAECREILQTAKDQARLCAKAFEDGDDKIVMSAACRQAARLR